MPGAQNLRGHLFQGLVYPRHLTLLTFILSPPQLIASITTDYLGVFQLYVNVILKHMFFCTRVLSLITQKGTQARHGVHWVFPS